MEISHASTSHMRKTSTDRRAHPSTVGRGCGEGYNSLVIIVTLEDQVPCADYTGRPRVRNWLVLIGVINSANSKLIA